MMMRMMYAYAAVCCMVIFSPSVSANMTAESVRTFISHEHNLTHSLMTDYDEFTRPADGWNSSVPVKFGISIIQLVDVDEGKGSVSLNIWHKLMWKDLQLTWDPADYNGITHIFLPAAKLWRPDITLFNSATHTTDGISTDKMAVVYPTGDVLWIPQVHEKVSCEFKLRHFPFDKQDCSLKYGSWVYDASKLDLQFFEGALGDTSNYQEHDEWELTQKLGKRTDKKYDCCVEKYTDVTFHFTLKRHSQYYMCLFISPAILISFLVPFLFVLDHKNKFPLGAGMIVSLSILLEMMDEKIPSSNDVPILAQYMVGLFGLVTLAFILCTITSNIATRAEYQHTAPALLRNIFVGCLGRLVCVRPTDYAILEPPPTVTMQALEKMDGGDEPSFMDQDRAQIVPPPRRNTAGRLQWKLIAIVLDRIFFVIFSAAVLLFTITVVSH